jgi:hypothetical protein
MHLVLLAFFIWFIETIILTFVLTHKNEYLISKRLLLFFGTGIITPIFAFLLGLISAGLQIMDNIDSGKVILFGTCVFIIICPFLTMKLIILYLNRQKKNGL